MGRTTGPEAVFYPAIEKWCRDKLKCWHADQDKGPSKLGRIDLVGVRDLGGGELSSRSEVIAVEVKTSRAPFMTSAGQAHGYSVMADRCYLAQEAAAFTDDHTVIASRLGIGLLSIRTNGKVEEVLSAPVGEPVQALKLALLFAIDCAACTLCDTVFRLNGGKYRRGDEVMAATPKHGPAEAAAAGKGLVWWLEKHADLRDTSGRRDYHWRRYLCADCTRALSGRPT